MANIIKKDELKIGNFVIKTADIALTAQRDGEALAYCVALVVGTTRGESEKLRFSLCPLAEFVKESGLAACLFNSYTARYNTAEKAAKAAKKLTQAVKISLGTKAEAALKAAEEARTEEGEKAEKKSDYERIAALFESMKARKTKPLTEAEAAKLALALLFDFADKEAAEEAETAYGKAKAKKEAEKVKAAKAEAKAKKEAEKVKAAKVKAEAEAVVVAAKAEADERAEAFKAEQEARARVKRQAI